MKHSKSVVFARIAVITLITGTALAGMHDKEMKSENDSDASTHMQKKKAMMKRHKTDGKMKQQVVATSDGGVVIVSGDMLVKYDKNLELVNKTTVEKSDKDTKKKMTKKKMGKGCSMCKMKMKDNKTKDGPQEQNNQ